MNCRPAAFLCVLMTVISLTSCERDGPEETMGTAATAAEEGAQIFSQHCQVCHGEKGKGDICPNLTDREWKYGSSDEQLFETISRGRPGGMPNWGNTLNEKQIRNVIAYIRSIGEK